VVYLILVVSAGCLPAIVAPELVLATETSSNSSILTPQTKELSKRVNTSLSGAIFVLTAATYWILMRYTPDLSHEIGLPPRFLENNIAALLSKTWPEKYMGPSTEKMPQLVNGLAWVLFCKAYSGVSTKEGSQRLPIVRGAEVYGIQGSSEVQELATSQPIQPSDKRAIKVRTFSPVMKSLVQVAVWNHVSFWMVLAMVVNTVIYNGFATNNITNDGKLRLILVGIFALANLLSQWHISVQLYRNFTYAVFQSCWTLICNDFIFLKGSDYRFHRKDTYFDLYLDELLQDSSREVWATLDLELFGKAERSYTHQLLFEGTDTVGSWSHEGGADNKFDWQPWADNDKRRQSHLKARSADRAESDFDKFTKPVRDAELKAYEKSAETVLEKMLANIAALLAICLATLLAPWTSMDKNDATTSQLGSYALLLTISTGLLAITSIIGQLANATESARNLLKLQERAIEGATTKKKHGEPPAGCQIENRLL
jgi:hypothetical protein